MLSTVPVADADVRNASAEPAAFWSTEVRTPVVPTTTVAAEAPAAVIRAVARTARSTAASLGIPPASPAPVTRATERWPSLASLAYVRSAIHSVARTALN